MPPDTETPTPLAIPDKAVARLHVCDADAHLHDRAASCVQAISAPVVAAELRRMAEEICPHLDDSPSAACYPEDTSESAGAARALRARADQLDSAGDSPS